LSSNERGIFTEPLPSNDKGDTHTHTATWSHKCTLFFKNKESRLKIRGLGDCLAMCLVKFCWPSPAQSFLVPSPAGLMIIFYCLTTLTLCLCPCFVYVTSGRTAKKTPPPLVGLFVLYAVRVVSKKSRRLVLP
jgi:hypothetical protein